MKFQQHIDNNSFSFEDGSSLDSITVAYHTSSDIESIGNKKVVWICHALTANSDAEDWWPELVGEAKLIDTKKYFVVCVNMLGSCYGSSGPTEINPIDGKPYLLNFPKVTVRDMVKANIIIRKKLGIEKIDLMVGSSIGGFQAIEWAIMEPEVIKNLVLIATSARVTAWLSAWEEAQRMALEADSTFRNPDPNNLLKGGEMGLRAARALALISYRSYEGYNLTQSESSEDCLFAGKAASYERYQGEKLSKRFDAYSYYSLSYSVDSHNVGRNRGGVENALSQIKANTTVIAIDSDRLFPLSEIKGMSESIKDSKLHIISSEFGHDGFLLENEQITKIIAPLLEQL